MGDFITGVRYFGQGFGMLVRRPRLLLAGMLPAVLTTVILVGGMIALIANVGHLAALVTPFADGWSGGEQLVTRFAGGLALVGVAVLLGLVGFTAVTLVVGGPFYEHIAERIEDDLGVAEGHLDLSWWKQFLSGLRDGFVLLLRSLVFTIPLFLGGFLPVVGQSVVPVLVALVTAWFMALEVVAVPFYRRGIGLRDRTVLLRRRRALAIGLGLPAALLCMIPLLAIVVMPVAFAGGVLVALDVLDLAQGGDPPAAFSVCRPSPSGHISRTPRPSSSASGKTVRSSDGVTRLAASQSQGLRPSAGWPIPFLTGHRANRPRRGGAVLMLHCMRVAREPLERRGGSRHD